MKEIRSNAYQRRFSAKGQADVGGDTAFKRMCSAFEQALNTHPNRFWESCCTFAGQYAHIRIVGRELAKHIRRPFRHLLTQKVIATAQHLRIDLWDESETAIRYPGDPVDFSGPRLHSSPEYGFIIGSPNERFVGCQRPKIVTWFDRATQHIIGCISNSNQFSLYERAKPLLFPLLLWHRDQDVQVIHAALVAQNGQGVLFVGRGGTGKSTAALACVDAGFDYLGDDYIGLGVDKDLFIGYSIYNSAWLESNHVSHFPRFAPYLIQGRHGKLPILLSQVFPHRLVRAAPIHVVVIPRLVDGGLSRTCPASKWEALFALAPTSLIKRPWSGVHNLNKLAGLVEQVPSYWLDLGIDLESIHECVRQLLA